MPEEMSKLVQTFPTRCHQFSNALADLIEHPECSMSLRLKLVEFMYDFLSSTDASDGVMRENLEARYLLPLHLISYQPQPKNKPKR